MSPNHNLINKKETTPKQVNGEIIKSPSDTTIYQPALLKQANETNAVISKISNFVENIRLETRHTATPEDRHRQPQHSRSIPQPQLSTSQEVQDEAEQIILDVEHLKADNQPPKGKSFDLDKLDYQKFLQKLDDDDEFFHVTCHISPGVQSKIAKGEFIDLEQLLPKDKGSGGYAPTATSNEENRVELVSRDGHT